MVQQTAVEWLQECLLSHLSHQEQMQFEGLFQQAKQMEKEQIINACNQNEFEDIDGLGIHETITKGEQYYNETYGGHGSNDPTSHNN